MGPCAYLHVGLLHNLARVSGQKIPPEQVFSMWKLKWFKEMPGLERRFTEEPGLEAQFLARPEVTELSKMSKLTVSRAIDVDHRLEVILKAAKNPPRRPKTTPTQGKRYVYVSEVPWWGSDVRPLDVFHETTTCVALTKSQQDARRAGAPYRVRTVEYKQAAKSKRPCKICSPQNQNR
jgi:hypothetical protein